jgi:hypothetical protein
LLLKIAERLSGFKARMIYGLSTGTLDTVLAKKFEKGTALVSKRLQALRRLQDEGYRTFGMICPILPQVDYGAFASELAQRIQIDKCEHVWGEVLSSRGDSMQATIEALRGAGRTTVAHRLEVVAKSKAACEEYARNTFLALGKVVPAEKLRFLQYVSIDNRDWWNQHEREGAVLLGKAAQPPAIQSPKAAALKQLTGAGKNWTAWAPQESPMGVSKMSKLSKMRHSRRCQWKQIRQTRQIRRRRPDWRQL